MARKKDGKTFQIKEKARNEYLVSYGNGTKWRFHAFIGDSFPSEEESRRALENGLKSKAIPQGDYLIQ